MTTIPMLDLRSEQVPAHRKTRTRRGRTVLRDPRRISGIVVHQTAARYGVTDRQLRVSGGNRQLALGRRALNVACHAMAFRDGFFVVTHELAAHVNHGNGFNAYCLGLEIDGRYPGLRDDPATTPTREDLITTWGGEPDAITDTIVATAREALRWLVVAGRAAGMPIGHVFAHRQSSGKRRSDPGEELWQRVVMEYAVPVLGLEAHPEMALGSKSAGPGRPIPVEWDPVGGVGRY